MNYKSSYYYIGQFSRFFHPGAVRIGSSGGPTNLESVAFVNPDGGFAVIVLNRSPSEVDFQLKKGADSRSCRIPAHAIQTYVTGR